jgi:catechol 2,3-dioxygenase-like lactoylglutathione lyase family enzyme
MNNPMNKSMTNRPRVRSVTPDLIVGDLQRSLDFYCDKLGFIEPNVWGEPPCFAMLNRDGFDLMLSLAEEPSQVRPNGPTGVWDIFISITDVAAEIAALEAAGVPIVKGPTDTFYEMREIEVLDPDGHRLCLAQDLSAASQRIAEIWDGVLDVGTAKLRLVLKLTPSDDGLTARLDSLDQNARDLVIDRIVREGSMLRFEMAAIGASYAGTFSDDETTVTGDWSQGGRSFPLVFRRV